MSLGQLAEEYRRSADKLAQRLSQLRLEQLEAQQRRDQEREYGMYRQTQVHFESLDSEVPHEDHP